MYNKIKFALVGTGRIAQSYVEAFAKTSEAELFAVADTNYEAAQSLAERLHCQAFASHETLANEAEIDAVIICTPPVTHAEISIDFLRRGTHVWCEKPFSIDSASALKMIDEAERNNVLITMASKFRYVEDVIKARSFILSGMIGEVVLFENAFTSRVCMDARWNCDKRMSGGGVLIDNGTHSVDIMRYLLGELESVHVVEAKRTQNLTVEETVRMSIRSANGATGSIDLSWSIDKELPDFLHIYGTEGTIVIGWKESKYRLHSNHEWMRFGDGYDKVRAFQAQIENFARAIRGTEKLLVSPADALASVQTIEAAYVALAEEKWTAIKGTSFPKVDVAVQNFSLLNDALISEQIA